MFWECARFLASCIYQIMQLHVPGTSISFLQIAVGLAFLPVIINVFARIFGGTIGIDTAMRTGVMMSRSRDNSDEGSE